MLLSFAEDGRYAAWFCAAGMMCSLRVLDLSHNALCDRGALALAAMLISEASASSVPLHTLELEANQASSVPAAHAPPPPPRLEHNTVSTTRRAPCMHGGHCTLLKAAMPHSGPTPILLLGQRMRRTAGKDLLRTSACMRACLVSGLRNELRAPSPSVTTRVPHPTHTGWLAPVGV